MNGQKQKIAVCVSGGGTNLQAIIDKINDGTIKNTEISIVISNKPDAYALERAKKAGIDAVCIRPKDYENRDDFALFFSYLWLYLVTWLFLPAIL